MTKITNLNEILSDWAYRVDGGMPDPKKLSHLVILEKTLIECGWNVAERYELIKNLQEEKPSPFVGITKDKKRRYFKDKEALDKAVDAGSVTLPDEKEKEDDDEKEKPEKKGQDVVGLTRGGEKDQEEPQSAEEPKDNPTEEPKGEFSPVPENQIRTRMKNVNAQLENAPDHPPHLTKEI